MVFFLFINSINQKTNAITFSAVESHFAFFRARLPTFGSTALTAAFISGYDSKSKFRPLQQNSAIIYSFYVNNQHSCFYFAVFAYALR